MSLTRAHIAEGIRDRCAYPKSKSTKLVESTLEIVKKALESGEDVLISGLGKFYVREKNPRRERNVISGDELALEARRVVRFRCSGLLKAKLNGKG